MNDLVIDRLDAGDLPGLIREVTGIDHTVVFVITGDPQRQLVADNAVPGDWYCLAVPDDTDRARSLTPDVFVVLPGAQEALAALNADSEVLDASSLVQPA